MTIGLTLALATIILAACTISYGSYAQQNGLPRGSWFYSEKPVFIGLVYLVIAVTRIVFGAMNEHFSWWWLLGAVAAFFVGPVIVLSELKEKTQIVGLFGTPLLLAAAFLIK